jgi:hypothetical protein
MLTEFWWGNVFVNAHLEDRGNGRMKCKIDLDGENSLGPFAMAGFYMNIPGLLP